MSMMVLIRLILLHYAACSRHRNLSILLSTDTQPQSPSLDSLYPPSGTFTELAPAHAPRPSPSPSSATTGQNLSSSQTTCRHTSTHLFFSSLSPITLSASATSSTNAPIWFTKPRNDSFVQFGISSVRSAPPSRSFVYRSSWLLRDFAGR